MSTIIISAIYQAKLTQIQIVRRAFQMTMRFQIHLKTTQSLPDLKWPSSNSNVLSSRTTHQGIKNKPIFASTNRCTVLDNESVETNNIEINQIKCITNTNQLGIKPPPSIFVYGLLLDCCIPYKTNRYSRSWRLHRQVDFRKSKNTIPLFWHTQVDYKIF